MRDDRAVVCSSFTFPLFRNDLKRWWRCDWCINLFEPEPCYRWLYLFLSKHTSHMYLDVSRVHIMCTLYPKSILQMKMKMKWYARKVVNNLFKFDQMVKIISTSSEKWKKKLFICLSLQRTHMAGCIAFFSLSVLCSYLFDLSSHICWMLMFDVWCLMDEYVLAFDFNSTLYSLFFIPPAISIQMEMKEKKVRPYSCSVDDAICQME